LNQLMSSRNRRLDPLTERFDIEAPALDQRPVGISEALVVDAVDADDEESPS